MPVNFFSIPCTNIGGNCLSYIVVCLSPIPANLFGICDTDGALGLPARVDIVNEPLWEFKVENNTGIQVQFKAVDWCVEIFRTGVYSLIDDNRSANQFSSDSVDSFQMGRVKRCEGFLYFDNKVLFIEIKTKASGRGGWIKDAREKFEETILSFREHHPNLANQVIEPILSNPAFRGLHQNEMVQKRILKDKVGLQFRRQNNYII